MPRRNYTWEDHDADPQEGGDGYYVRGRGQSRAQPRDRRDAIATAMAAHINANQNPAYKVTARAWRGGDVVRVYTNVGSYCELTLDSDGMVECSRNYGPDRGSYAALDAAWSAE